MKDLKSFKHELQNLITGNDSEGADHLIKTAQAYLKRDSASGKKAEGEKFARTKEERALIELANNNDLWVEESFLGNYITEGAEQKVYFSEGADFVLKIADGIFYNSWVDYFNNLLLHNAFFPNTAYKLIGFYQNNKKLYTVVLQKYIQITETTNLQHIKDFLLENGFLLKRNNDYFHPYLGIILEDLHDENVLTNDGVLFFVDTVFYITEDFYK